MLFIQNKEGYIGNIITVEVETGIPMVHEIVNILSEELPGLGAESFFTSDTDLILLFVELSYVSPKSW